MCLSFKLLLAEGLQDTKAEDVAEKTYIPSLYQFQDEVAQVLSKTKNIPFPMSKSRLILRRWASHTPITCHTCLVVICIQFHDNYHTRLSIHCIQCYEDRTSELGTSIGLIPRPSRWPGYEARFALVAWMIVHGLHATVGIEKQQLFMGCMQRWELRTGYCSGAACNTMLWR